VIRAAAHLTVRVLDLRSRRRDDRAGVRLVLGNY
jgi:hypothetical protein